ncbi:MAG: hypothetical protein M3Q91_04945 [Acidobacteriota bacterium]|nr:hypothetical protein [Acidobacteriota bacterium]
MGECRTVGAGDGECEHGLTGMKLVAGGNAPGKRRFASRPWVELDGLDRTG